MERLDCHSPRTCPSCEHFVRGGCALEAQIALALAPRAPALVAVELGARPRAAPA